MMRTVPLFGAGVRSYSDTATRQRRLNVMYDIRKDADRSAVICVGTPGAYQFASIPSAPVWGMYSVGSTLYAVVGTHLYGVSLGGSVSILGSLPTVARNVLMADNSLQIIIVDGVSAYTYTIATGTIAQITDGNFPYGASSVAFLDGRFLVEYPNSRQFAVSALLDGTTWSPQIYGTKENGSDLLFKVWIFSGTLLLFGARSLEFWQDIGAAPNPLQRISGTTQQWGLAAVSSVCNAGTSCVFLGVNPDGGVSVVMLNGYTPIAISDADIEAVILSFGGAVGDATALVYHAYGHSVYQLTFPSQRRTLCYDLQTQMWHEAQSGVDVTARHFAQQGIAFGNRNVVSDSTSGVLAVLDQNTFTDNGVTIKREVCTRHAKSAGNSVYVTQLMLEFETAVAGGRVGVELSRDGGKTFGPQKIRSLGSIGDYQWRVLFRRLGWSRDMVFRITVTENQRFILAVGNADVEHAE